MLQEHIDALTEKVANGERKICWICKIEIAHKATKDHITPKAKGAKKANGPWLWAHSSCNNIRQSMPFSLVREIQSQLDLKYTSGWKTEHIVPLLRLWNKLAGKKVYIEADTLVWHTNEERQKLKEAEEVIRQVRNRTKVKTTGPWKPVKLPSGITVWTPDGRLPEL